MPEQIGKYRIIERVGRGGMGTVYKAHDPVLDRLVALKVITDEGDVTDELKARFYREAQACARLSHPNIVVVHDLGEDAGQLFIVMEFLEGEELKHVIGQRRPVPLAEKLSWIAQVCEGLHYAHQHGIIHRDVKPGNIFVLRNGQVKILDFGIARIAAGSDPGLTRTGLIMGTLRYMSPEQARGRVDQRSDMFSVGAVLFELLSNRPAFESEDPMEILEKLRTEEPPLLTELDPAIPPELAAIVERALRKDPGQRFPDLADMRARIDGVRRTLADEGERIEAHVRGQVAEIRGLEATLARLLGEAPDDETLPIQIERTQPDDLRALAGELGGRLERLRERVRQIEAVEPGLARAAELRRVGNVPGAIAALERVLREVPEHPRAVGLLREARAVAPAPPPATARAAMPAATPVTRPSARPVSASPPPPVPRPVARQPAPPATPPRQPRGRRGLVPAFLGILALASVAAYALYPSGFRSRETPPAPAPAAPAVPPPAVPPPVAPVATAPAPTPAGDALDDARRKMLATREAAVRAEAERLAPTAWSQAAAQEREADAARGRKDAARAEAGYREAKRAFERAADEARRAVVLLGKEVEARRVQERAATARRAAEVATATRLAPGAWERASGLDRDAETALQRQEFDRAQGLWRDAETAYRSAEKEASEKASAEQKATATTLKAGLQAAEQGGAAAAAARRDAEHAGAPRQAARTFALARDRETEGQKALERQDYAAAQRRFREAQDEYQRAAQEAQKAADTERQRVAAVQRQTEETARLKQDVERLRKSVAASREQALRIGADRLAREAFDLGRAREVEATTLEGQQNLAAAGQAYQDAGQRYGEALSRAQVARVAKVEADQARARMQADKQRARTDAPDYRTAVAEEQRGDGRYEVGAFKEAAGYFRTAQGLFARAATGGSDARAAAADPRADIRSVLDQYRQAIEQHDLALLRRVQPGVNVADARRAFEESKSHKLDLAIQSIDVQGEEAQAKGRRVDVMVSRDDKTIRNEQSVVFKLRRGAAGWVIDAIN